MIETQKNLAKPHSVHFDNREKGHITGVTKVVSSNDKELMLETHAGGLFLAGAGLRITKFNADEGYLSFEGTPNALKYTATKQPLLKRMFS
ncbi:MAG: hypothetical protein FWE13_05845 [Firmicutes bacterium]|nr:hypothetical protein [Bacillota bacterium]